MTQMSLFWWPKQVSSASSGGGDASTAAARRHGGRCCCNIGRLMRKLRKQSKMLCSNGRPTSLHCQYDPLSYSRNFDRTGFGSDDSTHFYYTFSSRFVAPVTASAGRPQLPTASH